MQDNEENSASLAVVNSGYWEILQTWPTCELEYTNKQESVCAIGWCVDNGRLFIDMDLSQLCVNWNIAHDLYNLLLPMVVALVARSSSHYGISSFGSFSPLRRPVVGSCWQLSAVVVGEHNEHGNTTWLKGKKRNNRGNVATNCLASEQIRLVNYRIGKSNKLSLLLMSISVIHLFSHSYKHTHTQLIAPPYRTTQCSQYNVVLASETAQILLRMHR